MSQQELLISVLAVLNKLQIEYREVNLGQNKKTCRFGRYFLLVEMSGFEPLASYLRSRRSPN